MISNVKQKVSDAYRNNPFWDEDRAMEVMPLDYEEELAAEIAKLNHRDPEKAHGDADRIMLEALKHVGWEKLAEEYEKLMKRCPWWGCA